MPDLPYGISVCWQNRGFHAHGAGPCFDTVEQAVARRDLEDQEWAAKLDREVRRYPHLKARYDHEGWPDGRSVVVNGEPKLLYTIKRDGLEVHAATRRGAAEMFQRMMAARDARASANNHQNEEGR